MNSVDRLSNRLEGGGLRTGKGTLNTLSNNELRDSHLLGSSMEDPLRAHLAVRTIPVYVFSVPPPS